MLPPSVNCRLRVSTIYLLSTLLATSIISVDPLRGADGIEEPQTGKRKVEFDARRKTEPISSLPVAGDILVTFQKVEMPLREAVKSARNNPTLAEYRQLRAERSRTAEGQLSLARWCRSHGLEGEAELHWHLLLDFEPNHVEALKRLGLREFQGMLLTEEEIAQEKEQEKLLRKALKSWTAKLRKLRQTLKRGDSEQRKDAFLELSSIQDPLAIPALEEVFADAEKETLGRLLEVFSALPDNQGADFLVRQAVDCELPEIRRQASYLLSQKPYKDYVPQLLDELATPIELSGQVSKEPGRAVITTSTGLAPTGRQSPFLLHRIRLKSKYTASDVAVWGEKYRRISTTAVTGLIPDRYRLDYQLVRESPNPDAPYVYRGQLTATDGSFLDSTDDLQQRVEELNAISARRNQRVHEILVAATGQNAIPQVSREQQVEVNPRLWWQWWRKQRELNNYIAKGMEVWTQFGPLPVEELVIGDRVLTQNAESGILLFNFVLGIDVQPQSEMQSITIGGRTIITTPEQLFFTNNGDLRQSRELEKEIPLNSLAGPRRVEEVRAGKAIWAYSLLIQDSPNYFVDRLGIQIRDATPITAQN